MILTERYTIKFAFLENIRFNQEYVGINWNLAATRVYNDTGIFVNAIIDERLNICNNCRDGETCVIVTVVRNPIEVDDSELFYNTLKAVLITVKENLNNPYTLLTREEVESTFFFRV